MINTKSIPKVELHVHLDGSLNIDTVSKILNMPKSFLKENMIAQEKCLDLNDYLTKFDLPVKAMQKYDDIKLLTSEFVKSLKDDNVIYAEVRFAPLKHTSILSPDEVINRSSEILRDLGKNHIYNGYAINGITNNESDELTSKNEEIHKKNTCSNVDNSLNELELEMKRLEESNLKNEYESLKLEQESLSKSYKKIKKDYDKLYDEYEKLKIETQNNKVNEEVAISMDQISFDIVKDNNILDEIKNLDILSMTPLDAMNALFSLQKKVKNK